MLASVHRPLLKSVWRRTSSSRFLSGGSQLEALKAENPHTNVVHYTHKNQTFTVQQVDYFSTALAIGLAENGLTNGDVVLSWLPSHFSESMVLQFACSKAGFVLYTLDPALAVTDPAKSTESLAKALEMTKANVLVSQEAGSDVNYIRLAESIIPELRIFDYSSGMPFVTPHYPDLRFCLHTGFDQDDKWGWLPYRHMIVPSNNLDDYVQPVSEATPLAGELQVDAQGVPTGTGKLWSNQEVVQQNLWPTYTKVLQREFHTVEGVGVIF